MKRLLLILLALLPSLAGAGEIISTNSGTSGAWTNPAVWTGPVPNSVSNSVVISSTATITVSGGITVSNLIQSAGTIQCNAGLTIKGNLQMTGGWLGSGASGLPLNFYSPSNIVLSGSAMLTAYGNTWNIITFSGNSDPYAVATLARSTNASNLSLSLATGVYQSFTNTAITRFYVGGSSISVTFSNIASPATFLQVSIGSTSYNNSTGILNSCSGYIGVADSGANTSQYFLIKDCNITPRTVAANVRTDLSGTQLILSNITASFASISTATNSAIVNVGTTTLTPGGTTWDSVTANGTLTLGGALTTTTLTNNNRLVTGGNALTVTTLYSTNAIVASNSTVTATTITQSGGTFSNMTSTVRLSGTSNLTNYYNLAAIGNVTLTSAPITCARTLYSEAGSYSINGNGGTLTLTAPSYFNGIVSNATIGAGAPLTAERSQGVGGQINDIQRMGAE